MKAVLFTVFSLFFSVFAVVDSNQTQKVTASIVRLYSTVLTFIIAPVVFPGLHSGKRSSRHSRTSRVTRSLRSRRN